MSKNLSSYFVPGLLIGILITPFVFRALWWPSTEDIATKVADRLSIEIPASPSPSPLQHEVYTPGFWQKIAAEGSLSTVAIQAVNNPSRIISGIVLSADGLVATVSDVVPENTKMQISIDGRIYEATSVFRDRVSHVAILKIEGSNLIASPLDTLSPIQPGVELIIIGKTSAQPLPVSFAQRAMISHISSQGVFIDTDSRANLSGAKVINEKGKVMGLALNSSSQPLLVSSENIIKALNNYLESARK